MPLDGMQLGHYLLLRPVGSGGMGEVYLAQDTRITRQVAIKVIRTDAASHPNTTAAKETERLFQREMKAITLLDHSHILPLYDFGEEQVQNSALTYMVMPYRPEGSLADWLQQRSTSRPLTLQDITHIISQAAEALQHAHDHQIMHQDIKPSNFLIRNRAGMPDRPDLLLSDFGIARFVTAASALSQSIRGTPLYMAPEQWEGRPEPASDQYALAIMAYQLLTGHPPFTGRMEQIMHQHFNVQPQPPSKTNHRLAGIDAVILRALAKKPAERFPTISAFAHALQQAIQQPYALRATLAIDKEEARDGALRTLTLPGGRRAAVTIPPGAQHGEVLRIEEQGEPYYDGGPRGPLLLTLAIAQSDTSTPLAQGNNEKTERSSGINSTPVSAVPSTPPALNVQLPPYVSTPSNPAISPAHPIPLVSNPIIAPSHPESRPAHSIPPQADRPGTFASSPLSAKYIIKAISITLLVSILILISVIGLLTYQLQSERATSIANVQSATATSLTATATASNPTALAIRATLDTLSANYYPAYLALPSKDQGAFALADPLTKPVQWPATVNSDFGGLCQYSNEGFIISQSKTNRVYLCSSLKDFGDFAFEVQAKIKGDCGGISFRNDGNNNDYVFEICTDGNYYLFYYPTNEKSVTLLKGTSKAIRQGLNQLNTLAVKAKGSSLQFFVNQEWINSTSHSAYQRGSLGFTADAGSVPTQVSYRNARIWTF